MDRYFIRIVKPGGGEYQSFEASAIFSELVEEIKISPEDVLFLAMTGLLFHWSVEKFTAEKPATPKP